MRPDMASRGARRAANLSIDGELLKQAKSLKVNVSRAAEAGIARAVAEAQAKQWLAENAEALESSNTFVETHGLPLEAYRRF